MNALERKMLDVLKDLKENHYVIGIKAEFEAEGTRLEEALRLKEVCMRAGLGLTIKIGGCEAVRDLYECRVIGVERIVAPMVESAWALEKFLAAAEKTFKPEEFEDLKLAVNVETISAFHEFEKMLGVAKLHLLDGIVMGRVDLTGSMGMSRDEINSPSVFDITKKLFIQAKSKGLETAIGGGVSAHALDFFRALPERSLDRYETRKIVFSCPNALSPDAENGILKAVGFEVLWLKNKENYYSSIAFEDKKRVEMLEYRYKQSILEVGGKTE